jgi:hypothetical protein
MATLKPTRRFFTCLIYFFGQGGNAYGKKVVSYYRAGGGCLVINSGLHIIN